jgi:hypothetical protein
LDIEDEHCAFTTFHVPLKSYLSHEQYAIWRDVTK